MYTIETKPYGIRLTFGGEMTPDELRDWLEESKIVLESMPARFGVFVDMRTLSLLDPESQEVMREGQKYYLDKGMERSVVILNSHTLTIQFKRIAYETGIYRWERYVDASRDPDWENTGLRWIQNAVDPDERRVEINP
jgi:hypothetical protein